MPSRLVRIRCLGRSTDLEAAFLGDFPPGQYTAIISGIISGKNGRTGVAIIEIFKLPDL